MRVLGVDLGRRRIGLAISDATATLARPLRMLEVRGSAEAGAGAVARVISALLDESDGLGSVVVGLPTALDGTFHRETRYTLQFVAQLRLRTVLPVHLQDERLTSREAEGRLAQHVKDWRRRKAKLDAAAAAVILQDYLDTQPRTVSAFPGQEGS